MSDDKNENRVNEEEPAPAEAVSGDESVPEEESAEAGEAAEPSLEEQLSAAREESKSNYDRYLRSVAEMENYRRRSLREKEEARKYATSSLIEDLLPVLDNLELGLEAAENHPEARGIVQGFELVSQQIKTILKEHGVEEIDPRGEPFDPHRHESTGYAQDDEVPEGSVVMVSRKGYVLNDRLLRPAMVVLSGGPPAEESSGEESAESDEAEANGDASSEKK